MKRPDNTQYRFKQYVLLFGLAAVVVIALTFWAGNHTVYALPEYSARTGESCATCHVSAGGGGPRTLRGLLWSAQGRPDKVPALPGILIAPRVTDGAELYGIACSGCHGSKGEGLSAMGLANTKISQDAMRAFIVEGILKLGMPSFKDQLTSSQLNSLVTYVTGLSSGAIQPPPDTYPLPPMQFRCAPGSANPDCSTGPQEGGGN